MLEIDKLSKKNRRFGLKLFLSYILFTLLLIISITIMHMYFSQNIVENKFKREIKIQSSEKKDKFNDYFKDKKDAIKAIVQNEYFLRYVENGSYKYYIDLLLLTIMEANKDYMQIRYIDENGYEVLRFDRKNHFKKAFKSETLQNKSNRYYYQTVAKMKKNDIWFSKIDLNIEHGKIEIPYKPVVRVATPLYVHNTFKGILIINIFMEQLLEKLTKSSLYDIYLLDQQGFYIKHKNSSSDWSAYGNKKNVSNDFDLELSEKMKTNLNSLIYNNNIFVQLLKLDSQKINMIIVKKDESIQEVENHNNKMLIAILVFAILMSLVFTSIFAKAINNLFEIVVKQGDKLQDLSKTLNKKVQEKTLEIAKEDRLLQNQSKLAELGDMAENIAQQWKHPLTKLSLAMEDLRAFKQKNKINHKAFDNAMESSLYQIEFISKTINNLKKFYKEDEQKTDFIIKEAIENVLNIIGTILKDKNIVLEINDKEEIEIYANKNEFSQVLMNLMINAKGAIEENNIENGKIIFNIKKDNKNTKIEIKDNSGRIPSSLIGKVFDPYFTTKYKRGTGIELYLTKVIIEDKMHGKISVKNENNEALFIIEI